MLYTRKCIGGSNPPLSAFDRSRAPGALPLLLPGRAFTHVMLGLCGM